MPKMRFDKKRLRDAFSTMSALKLPWEKVEKLENPNICQLAGLNPKIKLTKDTARLRRFLENLGLLKEYHAYLQAATKQKSRVKIAEETGYSNSSVIKNQLDIFGLHSLPRAEAIRIGHQMRQDNEPHIEPFMKTVHKVKPSDKQYAARYAHAEKIRKRIEDKMKKKKEKK